MTGLPISRHRTLEKLSEGGTGSQEPQDETPTLQGMGVIRVGSGGRIWK
jgi:hypothetical protein